MAAPVIASQETAVTTSTGSLTISKPSGVVSGDLLVAILGWHTDPADGGPGPSGWTQLFWLRFTDVSSGGLSVYWKVAGGSEPSSYTWTESHTVNAGILMRITGALDPAGNAIEYANAASLTCPAVTPSDADSLVIRFGATYETESLAANITLPAGGTTIDDILSTQGTERSVNLAAQYFTHGTSSTGTSTFTGGAGSGGNATGLIAIAPSESGGGGLAIPIAAYHYNHHLMSMC